MKQIALHGKNGEGKSAIIDDEDFDRINQYKWYIADNGANKYVVRVVKIGQVKSLQREVMQAKKGQVIRIVDGDYFDCRKENLQDLSSWKTNKLDIDEVTRAIKIKVYGKYSQDSFALVDIEDHELVSQFKWYADKDGYATRTAHKNGTEFQMKMHRLIMNAPKGIEVDHVNGSRMDNRRCNLRLATRQQQSANYRIPKTNKSGYKGVHWDKRKNKWVAVIRVNKKNIYAKGTFANKIEAAKAYDRLAKKYFGEFAKTNF